MYRRDSRGSISNIQQDILLEFENYKKKFLLANRHITKLNSTLSVRVEELNGQLSTLYAENLRLRASEIALAMQLKREKEKSYKMLLDTESATMNLLKQLGGIRQSFNVEPKNQTISQPLSPLSPKTRQPVARSPVQPRLAQPPSIPGISEDPEPLHSSCDEFDRNTRNARHSESSSSRIQSSASKLPLPSRISSPPLIDETTRLNLPVDQVLMRKKKPLRRHSGLLTVSVENLPRPSSPALGSPLHHTLEMIVEAETEFHSKVEEQEETIKRAKKKIKNKERELCKAAISDKENMRTAKDSDSGEDKLRDVTNSMRRRIIPQLVEEIVDDGDQVSQSRESPSEVFNDRKPLASVSEDTQLLTIPSIGPTPSGSQSSIASDDDNGNPTSRERRARKSVNYAEPKLNTKMRKPDNFQGTTGRPSLTLGLQPKTSKHNLSVDDNDLTRPPLPSPPLSSPPLLQNAQTDPREVSPQRSPSLLPPHMMTITKRKKLPRPALRPGSDDDNDDGDEADAEWEDNKSSLSSNSGGRRKSCQSSKGIVAKDTRVKLDMEDRRRHSLAV